ncbi:hypothetical protein B0H13DRAFT_1533231, partial [Mycena leptocephala]
LFPFADTQERYWSFAFVGFCLGTSGVMIAFTTAKWVEFPFSRWDSEPSAPWCAAETGIITSIQTTVQQTHGGPTSYFGRKAGFWFLFGAQALLTATHLVFMKDVGQP